MLWRKRYIEIYREFHFLTVIVISFYFLLKYNVYIVKYALNIFTTQWILISWTHLCQKHSDQEISPPEAFSFFTSIDYFQEFPFSIGNFFLRPLVHNWEGKSETGRKIYQMTCFFFSPLFFNTKNILYRGVTD